MLEGWEFARSVVAQALGTVLGGGVLALIGVIVGALDSPWLALSLVSFAVALVFYVLFVGILIRWSLAARRRDG
jgi:hypothetical protein